MSHWYFEPVLNSYAIAIGLAIGLVALLFIVPRFKTLSRRRQNILITLRALLIGLLLLGLLRPSRISTDSKPQSATLVILYDQSRSLTVADAAGGKTRWQALRQTLDDAAGLLAELSDSFELRVYGFDTKPVPRALQASGRIEVPAEPLGEQTDIGQAIHDAINREVGKRIAGVIVLGDGAQRAHRPSVDLQQTARELARLGYPLYTVTYGRPRDQSQARDVAIQNLQDQYSVFVRNELLVRGTIAVQGFANRPIPVTMLIEPPSGKQFTADAVELTAHENNQQVSFEMSFTPEEPGQHKMTIVVADQPGELVTDNNQLAAYVNALDGGMRVLFLHSNLWAEQSFLERSIGSSPDIQLDKRFVDMRLADQWPIDLKAELETDYDVFLICDVDAAALGGENASAIAQAVADGRGLIMTGGYHSFGAGGYGKSPLGKLLPITISRFEQQELGVDAPIRTDLQWDKPMQMLPTGNHFITRLASPQDNESVWRQLKPLQGANKFARIDRRATVLARANDAVSGEPLLVGWLYGDGRVLAFAGDTTYRWWTYSHQTEHKRFWRQSMLWLAQKDAAKDQDVWIQLAKRRFLPGDPIQFSAGARGVDGEPLEQAQITAELVFPGEDDRQPVLLTPEGEKWVGLWEEVLDAGEFQIDVSATFEGKKIGQTSGRFVVLKQDLELTDPAANPERMQLLASLTSAVGGKSVAPEQFNALLEEIQKSPPDMQIDVESKWQFGDTDLSVWAFFVLFVGLISTEWFLRKRWQLV